MRLERIEQLEIKLADQRGVARSLLEDGIDDHRLACFPVGEQVSVGRGLRVEELTEDEHGGASFTAILDLFPTRRIQPCLRGRGPSENLLAPTCTFGT